MEKLRVITEHPAIHVMEYYFHHQTGYCFLVKLFLVTVCEYLLLYIPSDWKISAQSVFQPISCIEIQSTSDPDDYASTGRTPDLGTLSKTPAKTVYEEETKRYEEETIHTEAIEEPVSRRLERQLMRLILPFKKIQFTIAMQSEHVLVFRMNGETRKFKTDKKQTRSLFFFLRADRMSGSGTPSLIEDIVTEIGVVSVQFFESVKRISIGFMDELQKHVVDFDRKKSLFLSDLKKHVTTIEEGKKQIARIKLTEQEIVSDVRARSKFSLGTDLVRVQEKGRLDLEQVYKQMMDIALKVILIKDRFHALLFHHEEIAFDTNIMLKRVEHNLKLFGTLK